MQFIYSHVISPTEAMIQTEWFLHFFNETHEPLIHLWQTRPCVILGMKDQRLPHLQSGLTFLHQQNYNTILRSSGGLAVVSDPGVLNISLFLPASLSINEAYEKMSQWLQERLNLSLQIGEIEHSYCPGHYDLSYQGQKVAGMSQRRFQDAAVVMLYLSVTGPQQQRSELIRSFYQQSKAGNDYPSVEDKAMTSLVEIDPQFSLATVENKLLAGFSLDASALEGWMRCPTALEQRQKITERFNARQSLLKEGNR